MRTYTKLPATRRLQLAHTAIANALDDDELLAILAPFAYHETKLHEGLTLYLTAESLHHSAMTARGRMEGATADLHTRWDEARTLVRNHLPRARIALRYDTSARHALRLDERRAKGQAAWIVQARHFYVGALTKPAILAKLTNEVNLKAEDLETGLAAVDAFEQSRRQRYEGVGESRHAMEARNAAMAALDEWVRDFRDTARIALVERPQLIERLGFVQK